MQVVGDDLGLDPEQSAQVACGLDEGLEGRQMLEIADVMAAHELRLFGHRDGVLELRADGEHLASRPAREGERLRGEAAGPPHHLQAPSCRPHDRVVAADVDRTIVRQHGVDQGPEPCERLLVGVRDRVVGPVSAAHHEGPAHLGHQQVVERRVGQHQAEVVDARCDRLCDGRPRLAAREHDGPRDRDEGGFGVGIEDAQLPRRLQVGDHEGERLVVPGLSPPQLGHRAPVGRVSRQVVAADALDGQDLSGAEHLGECRQRGAGSAQQLATGVVEGDPRAADGTGVRLGVEAPVGGIVVLGLALGAHLEARHRRRGPVVRDREHDGVARPAVRAVGEGVAVAAVAGLVHFGQAVAARRAVGAHRRVRDLPGLALYDPESLVSTRVGQDVPMHGGDPGEGRRRRAQEPAELGHVGPRRPPPRSGRRRSR